MAWLWLWKLSGNLELVERAYICSHTYTTYVLAPLLSPLFQGRARKGEGEKSRGRMDEEKMREGGKEKPEQLSVSPFSSSVTS